ncbi:MAG TPA: tetratricopeptide repeat protein, partial [Kofleriaceae bacterium]|nr:tetratricopeptide repeat protein [Kofleriaceae bacterium]
ISDFGLARGEASTSTSGDGATLTGDQALVGTPAYMAPEQVECKPATPATDIYALGIVMFEMVTGELPFRADTPMATAVLRLKQPAPSARARRPELSAGWDRTIARCLEIDPPRRFARASDVLAAIDSVVPRRRVWPFALAGGALAAASLATVLTNSLPDGSHTPTPAPPALPIPSPHGRMIVAVDPKAPEAWRGAEAGEQVRAGLRVAGKLAPLDGATSAIVARELAESSPPPYARIVAQTGAQVLVTGEVRGDAVHLRAIDPVTGRSLGEYDDVVALRRALLGGDAPPDADSTVKVLPAQPDAARAYAEGIVASRAHDHATAIDRLQQATTLAPDFAPAYLALADELRAVRQSGKAATAAEHAFQLAASLRSDQRVRAEALYRESRKEWTQAQTLWRSLLDTGPDDVAIAQALAQSYLADNAADKCFETIDSLRARPAPVGDDPRLDVQEALCARRAGDFKRGLSAATRADLKAAQRGPAELASNAAAIEGEMLADGGEYDRALVVLQRAQQLAQQLHDGEAEIEAMRQLGYVLGEQGKHDEAIATYQAAVARAKQIGDHLAEGIVMNDWGQSIEQPEKALVMFQDALAIAKAEGDERLITATSLSLANKQHSVGKEEDALATYADVIERATRLHDVQNLAIASMNKGDALVELDRYKEALPLAVTAMASFQERGDEDGVGYAHITAGDAHMGLGEMVEARKDYEASLALRQKLGEEHTIAATQQRLARLDQEQGHPDAAEPRIQAAIAQYRKEDHPEQLADGLRLYAHIEIELGKKAEALAAADEMEKLAKPDPSSPDASELAMVRGIADPAHAAAQLPIIHAVEAVPHCTGCDLFAHEDEAQLEAALGHTARARALLQDVQRRAKAHPSIAARAAVLLQKL